MKPYIVIRDIPMQMDEREGYTIRAGTVESERYESANGLEIAFGGTLFPETYVTSYPELFAVADEEE